MAVKIRLHRMGTNKTPFYRVVVADSRMARDGRILENLGTYDPRAASGGFKIDADKAHRWMERGAQPTDTVRSLLRTTGFFRQGTEAAAAAAPTA